MLLHFSWKLSKFRFNLGQHVGLKYTQSACCGIRYLNGQGGCIKAQNANLCANRNEFLFWDWFHPTEIASLLAAKILFEGGKEFVTPVNFRQLAYSY